MLEHELLEDPRAHRPAGGDDAGLVGQAQGVEEGVDVLDHVAEATGRVDRERLGAAEAAQVGGDDPDVVGELTEGVRDIAPVAARERLPCTSRIGTPSSGPLDHTFVVRREVSTRLQVNDDAVMAGPFGVDGPLSSTAGVRRSVWSPHSFVEAPVNGAFPVSRVQAD